ncbi:MAG: hypothetical protein ABSG77_04725 [Candidatus Acidiferrum sp.]
MIRLFAGSCALALLSLISPLPPVQAQTAEVAKTHAGPFSYDVTKEVTLTGTVSSVLTKPSPGMIMGSHLLLVTSSGAVDASLGRFALLGKDALPVAAGQQVQVTGVMKTLQGQQVFLTRIVRVDAQVYTIRNKYGLALSPQARERLSQSAGQKGEQL